MVTGLSNVDNSKKKSRQATFRTFWHGPVLGPYQLLCLRSFVDHGHRVEIFTYDKELGVPDWVVHRDARDILPADEIRHYRSGFGKGSPALHSDLFRQALLQKLCGWWVDLDVVLLRTDVPQDDIFVAAAPQGGLVYVGVLFFPHPHAILDELVAQSTLAARGDVQWGEIGPLLWTRLIREHDLTTHVLPSQTAYPISGIEVVKLFDPNYREEIQAKCAGSWFLHLFHEQWRDAGIPRELGPPKDSFLDSLFERHGFGAVFSDRMVFSDVERWLANRNARVTLEQSQQRLAMELEDYKARASELELKCRTLEIQRDAITNSRSWRFTQPLRMIRTALSRARD